MRAKGKRKLRTGRENSAHACQQIENNTQFDSKTAQYVQEDETKRKEKQYNRVSEISRSKNDKAKMNSGKTD